MLVKCNKYINLYDGTEMDASPWFVKGHEYTVLAFFTRSHHGPLILLHSDIANEPRLVSMIGFEVISQEIPQTWIPQSRTVFGNDLSCSLLPKPWEYDRFERDLFAEDSKAVSLYNQEAKIIFEESGKEFIPFKKNYPKMKPGELTHEKAIQLGAKYLLDRDYPIDVGSGEAKFPGEEDYRDSEGCHVLVSFTSLYFDAPEDEHPFDPGVYIVFVHLYSGKVNMIGPM